jgi:hypothetical protein
MHVMTASLPGMLPASFTTGTSASIRPNAPAWRFCFSAAR